MSISGKAVADLISKKELNENPSALDMGNQTYAISQEAMSSISDSVKRGSAKNKYKIDIEKLVALSTKNPANKPGDMTVPLVEDFYKAIGFSSYNTIDINTRFGGKVMDLNKDLKEFYNYEEKFDLVTNIGVSEHLFDQAQFLKNAHELTKVGGIMLHMLPFTGFINHGFFNYEPRLFEDLAEANGYEVLRIFVSDTENAIINLQVQTEINTFYYHYTETLTGNAYGNTLIVAILRKIKDKKFVVPIQGKYKFDIEEGDQVLTHFKNQKLYDRPVAAKGYFVPKKDDRTFKLLFQIHRRLKLKTLRMLRIISKFIINSL